MDRVADVEYTIVDTVSEALLLEATLIKRHQPRFNVRLKDDKSYPYIKITLADDFPRIERTRKLPNDGSRYFGPYASASSVDEAMNLVRRLFPFRTCTIDIKDGKRALPRPCLLYHIKRCQGPCIEAISKADYRADIEQVSSSSRAARRLVGAAHGDGGRLRAPDYERAADLRDKLRAIERTMESQKMAAFAKTELDLLGLARQGNGAAVQLFAVRDGKTVARDVFLLEAAREAPDDEALAGFLKQYYARARRSRARSRAGLPASLTPDADLRRSSASGAAARSTARAAARREARADGARRAQRRRDLAREQARWLADEGKTLAALEELADALGLAGPPMRIECYDISNIQGANTVGSMVVFEEGRPRTGEYRRFRIKTVDGPNDFASHREVLRRRFRLVRAGEEGVAEELRWAMPDLVIIDGGMGQVNAAKACSTSSGCTTCRWPAWPRSARRCSCPAGPSRSCCRRRRPALYLLQRLRDEAHRFAITYHRKLRDQEHRPLGVRRPARRRARSASERCCGSSDRSSGSARRRSSRSPRSRASAGHWPSEIKATLEA